MLQRSPTTVWEQHVPLVGTLQAQAFCQLQSPQSADKSRFFVQCSVYIDITRSLIVRGHVRLAFFKRMCVQYNIEASSLVARWFENIRKCYMIHVKCHQVRNGRPPFFSHELPSESFNHSSLLHLYIVTFTTTGDSSSIQSTATVYSPRWSYST